MNAILIKFVPPSRVVWRLDVFPQATDVPNLADNFVGSLGHIWYGQKGAAGARMMTGKRFTRG